MNQSELMSEALGEAVSMKAPKAVRNAPHTFSPLSRSIVSGLMKMNLKDTRRVGSDVGQDINSAVNAVADEQGVDAEAVLAAIRKNL